MAFPVCLILAIGFTQTPEPQLPRVEAKTLTVVPGPQAPKVADMAGTMESRRNIQLQARTQARRHGTVQCLAVPEVPIEILDQVGAGPGWKAYRVEVPANGKAHARIRGDHEAWFRVMAVNRWGRMEEGMLQNIIQTGNPEASFNNPKAEKAVVYFIVDTTELGVDHEPYALQITFR